MAETNVKPYVRVNPSGTKVLVGSHSRRVSERMKAAKSEYAKLEKKINAIEDSEKKRYIKNKYGKKKGQPSGKPANLKLMLNSRWKDVKIKKYRINKNGKRIGYMQPERRWSVSRNTWEQLLSENRPLMHKIINRYLGDFKNSDLKKDMYAQAMRAIFDAANNYEDKYNPKDPKDVVKHFSSYIAGYVRDEMARQLATRYQLPYAKRVAFSRFREHYDETRGDFNKLHDILKLRKKDLYPNIEEGGDELIPKEGYVTSKKRTVLEKKTKEYEGRVNRINDKYNQAVENVKKMSENSGQSEDYEKDLAQIDAEISKLEKQVKNSSDAKSKAKKTIQIDELKKERERFAVTMQPMSEEELNQEIDIIEKDRQNKLKEAKAAYESEIEKTTIQGTFELFKMFEELMSNRFINVTEDKSDDEGQKGVFEEIVKKEDINPEKQISIKYDYTQGVKGLKDAINSLRPETAKIVAMRLGMDDSNELYAHGLWGVPMSFSEIEKNLPNNFFDKA